MPWHYLALLLFLLISLLLISLIALKLVWRVILSNQSLMQDLTNQNRDLVNLIASKDPMTYQTLTSISPMTMNLTKAYTQGLVPMDDESVANRMAADYMAQGENPMAAFDRDAIAEFGFDV